MRGRLSKARLRRPNAKVRELALNRAEYVELVPFTREEIWRLFDMAVPSGPPSPQYSTKAENEAWLKARFG